MKTGADLIADIDAAEVAHGRLALWWIGQFGFVIKAGRQVLYLDPFLSAHAGRRIAPLLQPSDVKHASLILGSHDHIDHIDHPALPGMLAASPSARLVVPEVLIPKLAADLKVPESRFLGLNDGATLEAGGLRLTGVAAAHEFLDPDASGRFPYQGTVIEANGCVLYHSGDCCVYEGLQTKLKRWKLDAMLLPINGRDAARYSRRILGNMTYQEAADLAGALKPGVVIPAHYEMFADNACDPQLFVDYVKAKYPTQKTLVCAHGQKFEILASK